MTRTLLLLAGLFTSSAFAVLGYMDADNPGEAVGMIKTQAYGADSMMRECSSRFPVLTDELKTNLKKWQVTEASVLKKADKHWAIMVEKDRRLLETPKQADQAIKGQFDILEKTQSERSAEVLKAYCRQHFSNLASGIWRERTPRAYGYMDRAP
jgi:hypothetical protein